MIKLWKHTWTYKTYNLIKCYNKYRHDKRIISPFFYSPDFSMIMKKYLNVDLREDWLGRLYGVVNPSIDKNGFLNISNSIIEFNENGNTSTAAYNDLWVVRQLDLIANLFNLHKLYEYINYKLEHIPPINYDNYLLILDIVSRKKYATAFKSWLVMSILYIIIALIVLGIIFL